MNTAIRIYKSIGKLSKIDAQNPEITNLFIELHRHCQNILTASTKINLISKIPGKQYFVFHNGTKNSRAVNEDLFINDVQLVENTLEHLINNQLNSTTPDDITKALYTMAISFCAVIGLGKSGDQKTPGTFFEYFSSHWFAKTLRVHPQTSIQVLNLDRDTSLPTDYIYDLGNNRPKIHLPVKTSTRERVIQVWAHQRVLDGVYGTGRFLGMLVCLSETKTDQKKLEVTDICLPEQWRAYQLFIAQMYRIYYLDAPTKYLALNNVFPPINVRPLGEYFYEVNSLFDNISNYS
ncbi:hypothetical protein ABE82_25645 [Paenibacillus peoriae]|uniref:hypothetical protein n=1 Tax=Paenibacillus TaxID=44249 RepID=UPI0006A723A2|nr:MULTISPECIES: hypothetical protein [Paenibacillus]ALA44663.1 hypothetical protein ABE82_25645 [Paenibacillus peoriae]APB73553.1 hypothetical protein PPYC2_00305 [Paenibacillus polymyxa]POR29293.1 hypothetical protein CG775_06990 [Paenibacillus polymyxa]